MFFEFLTELFKHIVQDYGESPKNFLISKKVQEFFLRTLSKFFQMNF